MKSVLLNLSSRDAVHRDPVRQNGSFRVVLNNPNHINSATRVVAHKIVVPNAFPNVRSDHAFYFNNMPTPAFVVPEGFYTAEQYITAFKLGYEAANTLAGNPFPDLVVVQPPDGNPTAVISFGVTLTGAPFFLLASKDTWNVSGWITATTVSTSPGLFQLAVIPGMVLNQVIGPGVPLVNPTAPPNLAGIQLAYVAIKQSCQGNLVSSNSSQYNILGAVSMSGVTYGSYATERAVDIEIDEVYMGTASNLQTCDIDILDESFRPLVVPLSHDVTIILKVFHTK